MAVSRTILILALLLASSCKRNDAASVNEISLRNPIAIAATKTMYRDNPSTFTHRDLLIKAYYVEGKSNNCIWFVYDPRVGFNDSEFIYCTAKGESRFRRL